MAHQPNALKILAIGSPLSALSTCVAKITAINAKHGPFDACVLVGDVFAEGSDGSEVSGVKFPVPTYFTVGKYALPGAIRQMIQNSGGEVVENLVFLGKSAILTTAQGLKIGAIGGTYDTATYTTGAVTSSAAICKSDISSFLSSSILNPTDNASSLASARDSAISLPPAFHGLDLLLFSSPPPSLSLFSPSAASLPFSLATPAAPLSDVVSKARPRYMFWGEGEGFWEREPLGWAGENGQDERWTRAVKLGALGGEDAPGTKKARWFYAFSLPAQSPSAAQPTKPANATPNPFTVKAPAKPTPAPAVAAQVEVPIPIDETAGPSRSERKRAALEDQSDLWNGKKAKTENGQWEQGAAPPEGYVCKICQSPDHFIRECPNRGELRGSRGRGDGRRGGPRRRETEPAECWFCLSNPKVTKHLIVAIGEETYVTLPKGQLIPTTPAHVAQGGSAPLVPGGGHVLIIPIAHHPTLLAIPADDATKILSEIETYKEALRKCYEKYNAVPVVWEVGRIGGRGGHAHVQIVPVPKELAGQVASSFKIAGEKQGLDWEENPQEALARVGDSGSYFKVDCPDGTTLVHLLKGNFDLQFGRIVLGSLLGYQHRIDWKDCGQSEAEEKADAQTFKKAFTPFNS